MILLVFKTAQPNLVFSQFVMTFMCELTLVWTVNKMAAK